MDGGIRTEMSPMEIEAVVRTIRGMGESQQRLVAQSLPVRLMCEEIANRYDTMANKITSITSIMENI
jgi:hypothetical protein